MTFSSVGKVWRYFFFLSSQPFFEGRGWSVVLVLDLPVNQIHQEFVAEEIKLKQQDAAGAKKKKKGGQGFLYVAPI